MLSISRDVKRIACGILHEVIIKNMNSPTDLIKSVGGRLFLKTLFHFFVLVFDSMAQRFKFLGKP